MAFKDHLKQAATAVEEPPTMENTVPLVQENITYYHWAGRDAKGRAYPSSEIIHVSGGESRVTTDGQKVIMPEEHIDFHNGMYTTNDPNKIKVLERFCANPGNCVTRDPEVYYDAVMLPEERLKRKGRLAEIQTAENARLLQENSRLKDLLEKQGGKKQE